MTSSVMTNSLLNQNFKRFLHTLVLWLPLWLGTAFLFGVFGLVYSFFIKQDQWLASQALLVREEASGATLRLGRFDSEIQMKAAQETILEVAKHHQVVAEALKAVGPPSGWIPWWGSSNWPSKGVIDTTSNSKISMHAPKGAEFGATEVVYLDVTQPKPDRAVQFSLALCAALETRLQEVRKAKAESITFELTHARDSARHQLKLVTEELQKFERIAGIELSDLRGMTDMIGGGGGISRVHLDQLKAEIRTAQTRHQELLDDLTLLKDAIADPSSLVVTPTTVVTTQPGLKRLREGYAEAQLNASQLSGRFTSQHPLLDAARTTQNAIRQQLVNELQASLVSVNQEIKTSQQKIDRLRSLQTETEAKLSGLAENRAEYANVISEVKTRSAILETAERELAEAEASGEASSSTSLISRLDQPVVSDGPIGPGKTTITGCCTIAGLLFGIGIVFVISPNESGKSFGRRLTDLGRRQEDKLNNSFESRILPPSELELEANRAPSLIPKQERPLKPTISEVNEVKTTLTQEDKQSQRLERNLAASKSDKRRERPAPILYDGSSPICPVESSNPVTTSSELDLNESSVEMVSEMLTHLPTMPAASTAVEEHPKDTSFREFLMAEIKQSDDRRQQPRAAVKPAAASFSMRSSNPKTT